MPSTRQLRGGDFVLREEEEDLDILIQGLRKLEESPPDFSKVAPEFREAIERSYGQWHKRVDKLDTMLVNATSEEEQPAQQADTAEHVEA